jgi:hypothetical protein
LKTKFESRTVKSLEVVQGFELWLRCDTVYLNIDSYGLQQMSEGRRIDVAWSLRRVDKLGIGEDP